MYFSCAVAECKIPIFVVAAAFIDIELLTSSCRPLVLQVNGHKTKSQRKVETPDREGGSRKVAVETER